MTPLGLGQGIHTDSASLAEIFSNRWALTFNGTDEYVQIDAVGDDMVPATAGTISIWAIMEVTTGSATLIRGKVDSDNELFIFWHNASDQIRFTYRAGGTTKRIDWSASDMAHDAWIHFAMTWSASDDELKAYINGTQVGSTIGSLGDWSGEIDDMDLARNPADGAYFKGRMDEVSIWNEVANVNLLYNDGVKRDIRSVAGLDKTKLATYYQFEEGTGTTTADGSANGNTGELNNTPTWTAYPG